MQFAASLHFLNSFLPSKCRHFLQVLNNYLLKFLVRLHGEYNILVKLCGNTT